MALFPLINRVARYALIVQSRSEHRARFGKEAPAFDYSQPVKDWIDTRQDLPAEEETSYLGISYYPSNGEPIYDANRVVKTRVFSLFPEVATSFNLLPEPVPALGAITSNQAAMLQRKRPWPLELREGERVVLAPGIGTIPAIDDGKNIPSTGGGFTSSDRDLLIRVAAKLGA